MNRYVRDEKVLEYIGYSVPHPLENSCIMKVKFINDTSVKEVKDFMMKAIDEIIIHLNELLAEFKHFVKL